MNGWFVGVGPWYPSTKRKALFKTLFMRRVCVLRHQTGAQYSAVELVKDRAAVLNVFAPTFHSQPTSGLSNVKRKDSFLRNATR